MTAIIISLRVTAPGDRAGTLVAFEGKELGLGVVNPRTDEVETPAQIRSAVEVALGLYPAARVFLNPDCGFGTFSSRPMSTREIASAKVAAIAARGPRSARRVVRRVPPRGLSRSFPQRHDALTSPLRPGCILRRLKPSVISLQ